MGEAENTVAEPYPGYGDANADAVVKHVREDGREASELQAIRAAEEAREGGGRSSVLKAIDAVEADQQGAEKRYSAGELIGDARRLLGTSRHLAAGALYDAGEQRLTVGEAQQRLADYLERPASDADAAEASE